MCGDRRNQFDLRLGKVLRFGGTQTKVNFDLNNVFNAYPVLTENVSLLFSPAASILPAHSAYQCADRFLILPRHCRRARRLSLNGLRSAAGLRQGPSDGS